MRKPAGVHFDPDLKRTALLTYKKPVSQHIFKMFLAFLGINFSFGYCPQYLFTSVCAVCFCHWQNWSEKQRVTRLNQTNPGFKTEQNNVILTRKSSCGITCPA